MQARERIRKFLAETFLLTSDGFPYRDDDSLLRAGVIDSTGVLEVVMFVEETFRVKVRDDEIVADNFDSVGRLAAFVESKAPIR